MKFLLIPSTILLFLMACNNATEDKSAKPVAPKQYSIQQLYKTKNISGAQILRRKEIPVFMLPQPIPTELDMDSVRRVGDHTSAKKPLILVVKILTRDLGFSIALAACALKSQA